MKENIQRKVDSLNDRIKIVSDRILDLEQIKIQLQMLKRDTQMSDVEQSLKDCFDSLDDELKKYVEEVDLNNANELSLKLANYDLDSVKYDSNSYNEICSKKSFINVYTDIIDKFNFIRKKWE